MRRHWIPKLGSKEKRPLGIPTVRDRVVQTALRAVLEPIFERDFAAQSYGFRPDRGCKDALRRVDALLKQGYRWVVDADLKSYFDTIPQNGADGAGEREGGGRTGAAAAAKRFCTQGVMEDDGSMDAGRRERPRGRLSVRCCPISIWTRWTMRWPERGFEMVRYADDFVILCRSEAEARQALERGAGVDGAGRTDAASDEDADRGRHATGRL